MSVQLISLGLLGLSGYSIYRRSQKVISGVNTKPVHRDQELSARAYVIVKLTENIDSTGEDLLNGIKAINWSNIPTSTKATGIITFPNSTVTAITYSQLLEMNGLEVMRLANAVRKNPNNSPTIFDLTTKKLTHPLPATFGSDLEAVKSALQSFI